MKKLVYVVISLILASLAAATQTVNTGDVLEYGIKELKILGISKNAVKVSVGNVTNLISVGNSKEINDLLISVVDIIYFDPELSTASIDVTLKPSCGDNTCDADETSSNCCIDCGCSGDFDCRENKCVPEPKIEDECSADSDCDDNRSVTIDTCSKKKPGKQRKCVNHSEVICETHIDCDDQNPCTIDQCINNDCQSVAVEDCNNSKAMEMENDTILGNLSSQAISDTEVIETGRMPENNRKNLLSRLFSWILNLFA